MIAYVEGTLVETGPPAVIAVGGGIGLTVQIPSRAVEQLPPAGERVRLWTHLVAREDGWTLYGFAAREERALFRLLIGVSGVGPKLALGALSGAGADEIAAWLRAGDEKALARLPGIGKKTAARLVVELGQRVPADLGPGGAAPGRAGAAVAAGPFGEALEVLVAMGLPPARAESALRAARERSPEDADVETWVRRALRAL